jgi:hypothetical protein
MNADRLIHKCDSMVYRRPDNDAGRIIRDIREIEAKEDSLVPGPIKRSSDRE